MGYGIRDFCKGWKWQYALNADWLKIYWKFVGHALIVIVTLYVKKRKVSM